MLHRVGNVKSGSAHIPMKYDYDLIVIGSGPGGQKAAIQGLKLGKKVAIIDAAPLVGGNCLHDGTIPSKSFREAIAYLSGWRQRKHYGRAYKVKQRITMADLTDRTDAIERELEQTIRSQVVRNGGTIIEGFAKLVDAHHVMVREKTTEQSLSAKYIVLATGTRPRRPEGFEFDEKVILDSDGILRMDKIPKNLTIVGGGVIGCEYGSMFAALGVKVTILEQRDRILSFVDKEITDYLVYILRREKVSVITNDRVVRCLKAPDGRAVTYLESGKRVVGDTLLVSAGRVPNVEGLGLEELGIETTNRNNIIVNKKFQTAVKNIYAVGDVIGPPGLAATAMEQGRVAVAHAFGLGVQQAESPLPFGIFTIPEIAWVGKAEQELSEAKVPYEYGVARFFEQERGQISGHEYGILKILFDRSTLQVLGVHIIGENATELIHIGQTVMGLRGGIDYLVNAVFNYPTLAQCYKTAALDGMNKVVSSADLPDEVPDLDRETLTIN